MLGTVVLMGLSALAAAPKCSIEQEFWGHAYLKLVDVNGVEYKLSIPAAGTTCKFKTKTGWYLVDSNARIIRYQDRPTLSAPVKKEVK